MVQVHMNFAGGNITVVRKEGNTFYLKNQIRDTTEDWFYWAFCVEGAEGQTLTFSMERFRIGKFGPAVSHDYENWHWLNQKDGDTFTYTFKENETKVYFAHDMLYRPERFFDFAKEKGIELKELCKTKKGTSVPYFTLGDGEFSILMAARHHACESTGSYILEGVLEELLASPIENAKIFCAPMVDIDGVIEGDQGKSRAPYDHNRDYSDEPQIYPQSAAIIKYARENGSHYVFDFHSPWHENWENDTVFVVRKRIDRKPTFDLFSQLFENEISDKTMPYTIQNDKPPMTTWNKEPARCFSYYLSKGDDCKIGFALETAYFGLPPCPVSQAKLLETGKAFGRAVRAFVYATRHMNNRGEPC